MTNYGKLENKILYDTSLPRSKILFLYVNCLKIILENIYLNLSENQQHKSKLGNLNVSEEMEKKDKFKNKKFRHKKFSHPKKEEKKKVKKIDTMKENINKLTSRYEEIDTKTIKTFRSFH